jgi:hypothetical protein
MSEQYEVLAIRYGTRQASTAEVFLNYHAYREPDRPLRMDYFFWVARNQARSVVIDTGFSPAASAPSQTRPASHDFPRRPGGEPPLRPEPNHDDVTL